MQATMMVYWQLLVQSIVGKVIQISCEQLGPMYITKNIIDYIQTSEVSGITQQI